MTDGTSLHGKTHGEVAALRLIRPDNPLITLGLAVSYMMSKPAFAHLQFGDWSRVLVGQINRGHYYCLLDRDNRMQGFVGWALATRENAEAWVDGRRGLSYAESVEGDCLILNAWIADTPQAHRVLLDAARTVASGKKTLYFKRHYKDGSVRAMRLNVNAFVPNHIAGKAAAEAVVAACHERSS
ncbi:hemolysin-activating ACP:hemolysin acyltransferase [Rhodoblastus acidophilus]|uniref:toxin-activating lysine-acyltransferase n=1 Tax=Rhodoblastus acidophilus TaxID=1074 RepID=UPI001AED8DC7|nr:toxin-activating lysine-acyltransferase [Rhodoblastus acidophilus]MCW2274717.1 hemolysin-activating ACP:hemolysin acyltransferase [Rhodoblastus acidophilus]